MKYGYERKSCSLATHSNSVRKPFFIVDFLIRVACKCMVVGSLATIICSSAFAAKLPESNPLKGNADLATDTSLPLLMTIHSLEKKGDDQAFEAVVVFKNLSDSPLSLKICEINCSYEQWKTQGSSYEISTFIGSFYPMDTGKTVVLQGNNEAVTKVKVWLSPTVNFPILLQFGYKFDSHKTVWSNKFQFAAPSNH